MNKQQLAKLLVEDTPVSEKTEKIHSLYKKRVSSITTAILLPCVAITGLCFGGAWAITFWQINRVSAYREVMLNQQDRVVECKMEIEGLKDKYKLIR